MGETANPNETVAGGTPPAAVSRDQIKRPVKPAKPVDVTLDNTKDFATVHGERAPGDPHALVCFIQHGLPFDAAQKLIRDHAMCQTDKAKATVEKLEARARKIAERLAAKAVDEEPEEDEQLDGEDDGEEDINLKAWAMGQKKYRWQLVTDTILLLHGKRVTNKRDALETLIAEGKVQPGQLSAEHKTALNRL